MKNDYINIAQAYKLYNDSRTAKTKVNIMFMTMRKQCTCSQFPDALMY